MWKPRNAFSITCKNIFCILGKVKFENNFDEMCGCRHPIFLGLSAVQLSDPQVNKL